MFTEGLDANALRWVQEVISYHSDDHDKRRVFLSEDKNDNDLDCILSKIKIARIATNVCLTSKKQGLPDCDYYYDMSYSPAYSTFANLPKDDASGVSSLSTISSEECCELDAPSANVTLLDLYSGCGAMSTGLCHGANLAGLNLHTAWAVDINSFACQGLQLNHPKTKVVATIAALIKGDDFHNSVKYHLSKFEGVSR